MVSDGSSSGQKVTFFTTTTEHSRGKWELHLASAHTGLISFVLGCSHLSRGRVKVADAASVEGEVSDRVCRTAGAPARFKSDVGVFRFSPRNEKGEKVTDRELCADTAGLELRHTPTFKVQPLFNKHH